jgi:hypothetical protein
MEMLAQRRWWWLRRLWKRQSPPRKRPWTGLRAVTENNKTAAVEEVEVENTATI